MLWCTKNTLTTERQEGSTSASWRSSTFRDPISLKEFSPSSLFIVVISLISASMCKFHFRHSHAIPPHSLHLKQWSLLSIYWSPPLGALLFESAGLLTLEPAYVMVVFNDLPFSSYFLTVVSQARQEILLVKGLQILFYLWSQLERFINIIEMMCYHLAPNFSPSSCFKWGKSFQESWTPSHQIFSSSNLPIHSATVMPPYFRLVIDHKGHLGNHKVGISL